ncbi:type II toxin-antitoxin system ParD family antitoxin [Labrys okinawensis]|uniref:type II toxin-antitoxin system ParD family antitoxin n=1 Tax=Labrys okinawensis TaxID=346911 RepID=UPI0039BC7040
MRTTQAISITLPHDMLDMVKEKVASGEYASESEVIRDGLRSLRARDEAVEKWLVEQVNAAYDDYMKNPDDVISADEVFAELRTYHAAQVTSHDDAV